MRKLGFTILAALVAILLSYAVVGYVTQTVPAFERAITRTADVRPQSPIGDPAGAVAAVFDRISAIALTRAGNNMQLACDQSMPSCESGDYGTYTVVLDGNQDVLAVSRATILGSSLPQNTAVGVGAPHSGYLRLIPVDAAQRYYIVYDRCAGGLYFSPIVPTESACI